MIHFRAKISRWCLVVFILFAPSWSPAASTYQEITQAIQAATCEALAVGRTRIAIPAAPEAVVGIGTALGRLLRFDTSGFSERSEQLRLVEEREAALLQQRQLDERLAPQRAQLETAISSTFQDLNRVAENAHPHFQSMVTQWRDQATTLLRAATSSADLTRIQERIEAVAEQIRRLYESIGTNRSYYAGALRAIALEANNTTNEIELMFKARLEAAIGELYQPVNSGAEAEAIGQRLLREFNELIMPVRAMIAERRRIEMRFAIDSPESSAPILAALHSLRPKLQSLATRTTTPPNAEQFAIPSELLREHNVRALLQAEVQYARRLLGLAERMENLGNSLEATSIAGGALLRMENTIAALTRTPSDSGEAAPSINARIQELANLRKALRELNRTENLLGVVDVRTIRRLNLLEREAVLARIMPSVELRAIVFAAGRNGALVIPPAPVFTAQRPQSETPPAQPRIPTRVSSQSEASRVRSQIADYRRNVAAWQASWRTYQESAANYRDRLVPAYRAEVERVRRAQSARQENREAYVAMLAQSFPEFFVSRAAADRIVARARGITEARIAQLPAAAQARIRSVQAERQQRERRERDNDNDGITTLDIILFIHTGNPFWFINRPIALMMLLMDTHNPRSYPAVAGEMQANAEIFGISPEYRDSLSQGQMPVGLSLNAEDQAIVDAIEETVAQVRSSRAFPIEAIDLNSLTAEERGNLRGVGGAAFAGGVAGGFAGAMAAEGVPEPIVSPGAPEAVTEGNVAAIGGAGMPAIPEIPEIVIPEVVIPEIVIPEIPEIKIPEIDVPTFQEPVIEVERPSYSAPDPSPTSYESPSPSE